MPSKRFSRARNRSRCAHTHADDGISAQDDFRATSSRSRDGRKVLQLCAQVADVLAYELAGDGTDDILLSLQIVDVLPAPDAGQLLVIVAPAVGSGQLDRFRVLTHLRQSETRLRLEVAAAITRKRAPMLQFQYLAGPPLEPHNP